MKAEGRSRHVSDLIYKSGTLGGLVNNWIWEQGKDGEISAL